MTSGDPAQQRQSLRARAQALLGSDYFTALGVARNASAQDVTKAFIEAAKTWHPDRVPAGMDNLKPIISKVFVHLDQARTTLTDPARRAKYVEELAKPATTAEVSSVEAQLEFRKAEALLKKNDLSGAESHIRRAVALAPTQAPYQALLINLQAKPDATPDRLRELVAELGRLIARDAACERAFFVRGQLRKRLGLFNEAAADFARAAELNPQNIDAAREVRLHTMRQQKGGTSTSSRPDSDGGDGVGGFFKRLFKK